MDKEVNSNLVPKGYINNKFMDISECIKKSRVLSRLLHIITVVVAMVFLWSLFWGPIQAVVQMVPTL